MKTATRITWKKRKATRRQRVGGKHKIPKVETVSRKVLHEYVTRMNKKADEEYLEDLPKKIYEEKKDKTYQGFRLFDENKVMGTIAGYDLQDKTFVFTEHTHHEPLIFTDEKLIYDNFPNIEAFKYKYHG